MNAVLLASLVSQVPLGPMPMPGTNEWYQRALVSTVRDLEAGRFAEATRKGRRLPDSTLRLRWDDRAVPAALRAEFAIARDAAIRDWKKVAPKLNVVLVTVNPELTLSFTPTLPPNAESDGPAGAVYLTSTAQADPVVEGVIALKRDTTRTAITRREVLNETLYAIGYAQGLARLPVGASALARDERISRQNHIVTPDQGGMMQDLWNVTTQVRDAATAKRRLRVSVPRISTQPLRFDAKPVIQGEPIWFTVQMTNLGSAPLQYRIVPDCGCFNVRQGAAISPNGTFAIPVGINTRDFPGKHSKFLTIYTNDPESPVRVMPVTFEAKPRFRFLWNEPVDVVQVPEQGRNLEVFLAFEEGAPFEIKRASLTGGVFADVSFEPWTGVMADPKLNEPAKPRRGYRIEVMFGSNVGNGRRPVGLEIETTDPFFDRLSFPFAVQRGIVALPQFLNLGEVPVRAQATGSTLISRPGKPFKITRVAPESPLIRGTVTPVPGRSEFRLRVEFLGSPDRGEFESNVILHTDDPAQPTLPITVSVRVR